MSRMHGARHDTHGHVMACCVAVISMTHEQSSLPLTCRLRQGWWLGLQRVRCCTQDRRRLGRARLGTTGELANDGAPIPGEGGCPELSGAVVRAQCGAPTSAPRSWRACACVQTGGAHGLDSGMGLGVAHGRDCVGRPWCVRARCVECCVPASVVVLLGGCAAPATRRCDGRVGWLCMC